MLEFDLWIIPSAGGLKFGQIKNVRDENCMKKNKAHSIRYSQAVTHRGTNRARRCLTLVIGREPVFST